MKKQKIDQKFVESTPSSLILFPHQKEGVARILRGFCSDTHLGRDGRMHPTNALLLHDEMGLGKTIQALEALRRMMDTPRVTGYPNSPHLVVAPASCLHVWEQEIKRWFPMFTDVRVYSSSCAGKVMHALSWKTVVLVSYSTLCGAFSACLSQHLGVGSFSDKELARLLLVGGEDSRRVTHYFEGGERVKMLKLVHQRWDRRERTTKRRMVDTQLVRTYFGCIIMDEVHLAKNPQGKTCKALGFLAGRFRLALSGTPMMNHGGEILTLIRYALSVTHADWDKIHADPNGEYCRTLLKTVCFGRQKSGVPEIQKLIPTRDAPEQEQIVLEWTNRCARNLYVEVRKESLDTLGSLSKIVKDPRETFEEFHERKTRGTQHFWTQFQKLRQLCLHHFLLHWENTDVPQRLVYSAHTAFLYPGWLQEKCLTLSRCALHLCGASEHVRNTLCEWLCVAERWEIQPSPKMSVLWDILKRKKSVVAISQSRQFLEHIVRPWLTRNGVKSALFCGGSRAAQQRALHAFHTQPEIRVLLIVKSAGAHGLNLQRDSATVVLFDPHFNEALDEQAVQRVDRIGQPEARVMIRKCYMKGSVDEAMRVMQTEKSRQTDAWLGRSTTGLSLDSVGLFLKNFDSVGKK